MVLSMESTKLKKRTTRVDHLSPNSPASERLPRLIQLGAETLSTTLLDLARRNSDVDDAIERLIASPRKNVVRFKEKLANLSCMDRFIEWRERDLFVRELESLLEDLKAGVTDPRTGVELIIAFYESEQDIFDNCDDDGTVGQVFQIDARELFSHFAAGCPDKDWLCDRLLYLYAHDNYGVRDTLFDSVTDFLPEAMTRTLVSELWRRSKLDSGHSRHWTAPIELLARQLKDAELFERARRSVEPELSSKSIMDIAQVWLESESARTALSWVEKIPESLRSRTYGYDGLLLEIHKKLNDKTAQAAVAWRIFRECRSKDTLATLLSAIGTKQKKIVVTAEAQAILQSMTLSWSDAQFLIDCGSIDQAEEYITRSAGQIEGGHYSSILPVAEAMEKHHRYFAATVLYRALLDSILKRAYSRAYHHGIDYLQKLDRFAGHITKWETLMPHDLYVQQLRRNHSRKVGFWTQYEQ